MMGVLAGQLIMSEMLTRRRLLINGGLTGLVLAGSRLDAFALQEDLWATAAAILGRIKAPVFPSRDFPVTGHGAKGDGTTDCTAAFRAAIEACRAAGCSRWRSGACPRPSGCSARGRRCCA